MWAPPPVSWIFFPFNRATMRTPLIGVWLAPGIVAIVRFLDRLRLSLSTARDGQL